MVFICLRINQDLKLAPAAAVVFSSGLYEICLLKANVIGRLIGLSIVAVTNL